MKLTQRKFTLLLAMLLPLIPLNAAFSKQTASSAPPAHKENSMKSKSQKTFKTVYFAGGCFWGIEKLYESINGVSDAESGYANGKNGIIPSYEKVVKGGTEFKETVKVQYDPDKVALEQLLKAFFLVIDPTVKNRQAFDIGTQYQTGIYYTDDESKNIIDKFIQKEKTKYPVFAVEIEALKNFFPAEEYHQDYLSKNPQGYCHINPMLFRTINEQIAASETDMSAPVSQKQFIKKTQEELKKELTPLQYDVTQNAATERAFTGEYWNFDQKGIYVDITTGEPLFSSLDKYQSSCGWPSFKAPLDKNKIVYLEDKSYGMLRTEVKSKTGNAHLGHVFENDPESPNGIRYCINSASIKFIPYEQMEEKGYADWLCLFETK